MKQITLAITQLRKEKGITQGELADYLGITYQAVSKWENGTTLPDISLLPALASYFQVSVDQLLGLEPLKSDYIYRTTKTVAHWDNQLSYLQQTRDELWNEDYMAFLIQQVWRLHQPVSILDFGCGYGYLGKLMLPLLPKGSSYTGIDASETLITKARHNFKDSPYKTHFIQGDFNQVTTNQNYDIAICQAVLRHINNPYEILKKMISSVTIGGKVICIEINRALENASMYLDGLHFNSLSKNNALHKLWHCEMASEGRDHAIGMKLPFYMQDLGLTDIDVRMNDKVKFITPKQASYHTTKEKFIQANHHGHTLSPQEKEKIITLFMNRGTSREEAESYILDEEKITQYIKEHQHNLSILKALCLIISFGTKVK
ncbi:methyltransferase domain-containing protein [Vallitalea pronyensis]|uniref:Methyltransferase domain-containing protein n=1 Tax=Vallitalea pronyensis TaxID=1348613 RepID=A0A8J8MI93_9FIRM|nr:methyltransferase domain-containing protein [Vallitalea pronyensis]QUI22026.1 methyltransferase domain-containing protein [Vallitalea pronyensis]